MATTGKGKSKRNKGRTVDLGTFLGDQNAPSGYAVVTPKRIDWGDTPEDEPYADYKREDKKIVLPTAPKASRGLDIDMTKIPTKPPFTAFVGNLPFDISEEDILRFFGYKAQSVRLPRETGDRGRMRGFGYAEFDDRQALIDALYLNNEMLKNRPIKVSLAGEHEGDRDRKEDRVDRTAGDWRAAPREDSSRDDGQRNGMYGNRYDRDRDNDREPYRGRRSFENDKDNFSDKPRYNDDREPYRGRRSYDNNKGYGFGRERDFGDKDRDQNYGDRDRDRGYNRKYGNRDRGYGSGGFDREQGGGGGRNWREDNYSRDRDRDRGDRDRGSYQRREEEEDRDKGDRDKDLPKERPKLQLKPRSKPVESDSSTAASAIFGGAKPVNTAAKEREIEERLAREKDFSDKREDSDRRNVRGPPSGRQSDSRPPPSNSRDSAYSRGSGRDDERRTYSREQNPKSYDDSDRERDDSYDRENASKYERSERSREDSGDKIITGNEEDDSSNPVYSVSNKFSQLMTEDMDKLDLSD